MIDRGVVLPGAKLSFGRAGHLPRPVFAFAKKAYLH
jgi:hypothetical protein